MENKIMKITPEIAKEILGTSQGNFRYVNSTRTINPVIVKKYAADMTNGNWKISPQGIVIDENGILLDGHHRLHAVILSGQAVDFNVCFGAPQDCVEVLDCGWVRTPYNALAYTRNINKTAASKRGWALANLHFLYRLGNRYEVQALPKSTISDFIEEHAEEIEVAIHCAEHEYHRTRITCNAASNYAAFCALKCGVSPDSINRFFEITTTGMYDMQWQTPAVILNHHLTQPNKKDHGVTSTIYTCNYVQTCLSDYVKMNARRSPYKNPKPVFTEKWFEKLAIEEK